MKVKHFLSLAELGPENLARLLDSAFALTKEGSATRPLEGKVVGIYFRRPSTRTRTSFAVAAIRLGAAIVQYGPDDLQIVTGETVDDTARVLSGFLNALVIRTNETMEEMRAFAQQDDMAIINAMSEDEHPTQAIADLITIRDEFGHVEGKHILYVGEGNNTTSALALAVAQVEGMRLTIVTPEGYGLTESMLEQVQAIARRSGSVIEQHHRMERLPRAVDVVYTTRWMTMGEPKPEANWQVKFAPFKVTPAVMSQVSHASTIFMHDLPAVRGWDVVDEVLDGGQSRAFKQARHKLTAATAVLDWCINNN